MSSQWAFENDVLTDTKRAYNRTAPSSVSTLLRGSEWMCTTLELVRDQSKKYQSKSARTIRVESPNIT